MQYRRLGRTNLKVSVIGIGGGAFFGPDKTVDRVSRIISYGVENGINFIETAEEYDETKIGEALKNINKDVVIASKSTSYDSKTMEQSLANSIKKIGRHINIYMLQTIITPKELETRIENGTLDILKNAKRDGIIDFIGITGHRIPTLIEAIKTEEFDVVEVPYSIGQSESEKLFELAKDYNIGVIAIMCLGGGVLIDRDGKSPAASFMNAKNALGYVISNKNISAALVGMSSLEHIKENISIVDSSVNLSEDERKEIERKTLEFLGHNFCRSCKACMPCEKFGWAFNIDNFLRFKNFYLKYGIEAFAEEYLKLDTKADKCVECGKCLELCPYGVPIIKELKDAHKVFSGQIDNVLKKLSTKIKEKREEIETTLEDVKGQVSDEIYNKLEEIATSEDINKRFEEAMKLDKEKRVKEMSEIRDLGEKIKVKMDEIGELREKIEDTRELSDVIVKLSNRVLEEQAKVFANEEFIKKINTLYERVKLVYNKRNIQDEEIIRQYVRLNALNQEASSEEDPVKKGSKMKELLRDTVLLFKKIKFLD